MNGLLLELREEGKTKENKLYRCPTCHNFPKRGYEVVGHGQSDDTLECCNLKITGRDDIVKEWNGRVSRDIGFIGNMARFPLHKMLDFKDWLKELWVFYGVGRNFTEEEASVLLDYHRDDLKEYRKLVEQDIEDKTDPYGDYGEEEDDLENRFEKAKERAKKRHDVLGKK